MVSSEVLWGYLTLSLVQIGEIRNPWQGMLGSYDQQEHNNEAAMRLSVPNSKRSGWDGRIPCLPMTAIDLADRQPELGHPLGQTAARSGPRGSIRVGCGRGSLEARGTTAGGPQNLLSRNSSVGTSSRNTTRAKLTGATRASKNHHWFTPVSRVRRTPKATRTTAVIRSKSQGIR